MLISFVAYFLYILFLPHHNADHIGGNLHENSCELMNYSLTCDLVNANEDTTIRFLNNGTRVSFFEVVSGFVYFNLDLIIPFNVTSIQLENHSEFGPLMLNASKTNDITTRFSFQRGAFFFNQTDNFFEYFPRIQSIQCSNSNLKFGFQPSFISLKLLTRLELNVFDPDVLYSTFNVRIVRNLTKLTSFTWNGNLKDIEPDSLDGLPSLTYLDLKGNSLTNLPSNLFKEHHGIKTLVLDRNQFSTFSSDFFENLTQLTFLSIDNNPNFSVNSVIKVNSLQKISLQYNSYTKLSPLPFQQLPKLTKIYLDGNPFSCSCEMRWTSFVRSYGIEIIGGNCFSPLNVYKTAIKDALPYSYCKDSETYPCFEKNFTCPDNLVCINSVNGRICGCLDGYEKNGTSCYDKNECTNKSLCEQDCSDTQGSYECTCNSGFQLNSDGISCDDIDECVVNEGGCSQGYRNTPGSFECCGFFSNCTTDIVPYMIWGSVSSFLFILFLTLFLTILFLFICKCFRKGKPTFDRLEHHHSSQPSLTASYTKMEPIKIETPAFTPSRPAIPSSKPLLPPNKPTLAKTRSKASMESRQLPSLPPQNDELTYEAFDVQS